LVHGYLHNSLLVYSCNWGMSTHDHAHYLSKWTVSKDNEHIFQAEREISLLAEGWLHWDHRRVNEVIVPKIHETWIFKQVILEILLIRQDCWILSSSNLTLFPHCWSHLTVSKHVWRNSYKYCTSEQSNQCQQLRLLMLSEHFVRQIFSCPEHFYYGIILMMIIIKMTWLC